MITYISSKSGQGKSQLALKMALEASNISNNILVVSWEMNSKNILNRISSMLDIDVNISKEITVMQYGVSDTEKIRLSVFSNQLEQWMNKYGSVLLDGFLSNLGNDLDDSKHVFESKTKILEDVSKMFRTHQLFVSVQTINEHFWDIDLTKKLFFNNTLTEEQKKCINRVHVVKDDQNFHILNLNDETHIIEPKDKFLFKNI